MIEIALALVSRIDRVLWARPAFQRMHRRIVPPTAAQLDAPDLKWRSLRPVIQLK